MGPSALGLEARLVGPNEGANIVGHVEELRPLRLVEGELSGTPVYGSSLSAASTRRTRRGICTTNTDFVAENFYAVAAETASRRRE